MTDLPVDYRRRPWKAKYLTEETPVLNGWIIFGEHDDGTVDISDGQSDILVHVPKDAAQHIIAARRAFCEVIESEFGRRG